MTMNGRFILVCGVMPALCLASGSVWANMERLDDAEMSGISGQRGVAVELNTQMTMDTFSYFTEGNGIHLEGVSLGSASDPDGGAFQAYDFEIGDDGSLLINYLMQDQRLAVEDIRLDDNPNVGMGGFFFDSNVEGMLRISPGGSLSEDGYTFDSEFALSDGRFGYITNGQQIFLDGVALNINAPGQTLDVDGDIIHYRLPDVTGDMTIEAIRHAQGSEGFRGDASALASFGSIEMDFDFESVYEIQAGGRFGDEGLRIDRETTLNSANFLYTTDGHSLAFRGMQGESSMRDLRIEVAEDWEDRLGLAFTFAEAEGWLNIDSIEIGDTGSIGSVNMDWLFADHTFNGQAFSNQVFLQGGGHPDAGSQGMRLATQWSMPEANLGYTTNGNTVIFSGIQSWGRGDVTLNVTEAGQLGDTTFYDGLRVGFDDLQAGYRMDGLRFGDDEGELSGGAELLRQLGIYRAFEFESMDGHITLGAGGQSGEGITINSDIMISDGRAAFLSDSEEQGLWASDLDFDIHVRDMTLDVTENGLAIVQGEAWSTMDIGNLRLGDKDDGNSFGRIVWQRYGSNNEMVISAGGSNGAEQGLTIALKEVFNQAASDGRQNRFIWETNRDVVDGAPQNDTGLQLVLNNIHTTDGDGTGSNEFGVQTDLNIDVREATEVAGSPLGFSVNARTQFKELNIESVDLVHPTGGASTALYGVSLQNFDMEANLTATPLD